MGSLRISTRTKASSIVEVTTAMVIISIVFAASTIIYLQAQRSVLNWQKLSASVSLDNLYAEMQSRGQIPVDREIVISGELTISKEVMSSVHSDKLWVLRLQAHAESGVQLAEKKYLFVKYENAD